MKSLILAFASVSCLLVAIKAAAVEPVVAELQKDNSSNPDTNSFIATNQDCIQPKETGRCFALFNRFAFDMDKGECVEFVYGGCGGNSNNFESKNDCEQKCLKKEKNSSSSEEEDDDDDDDNSDEKDNVLNTTVSPNSETETTTEQVASS